MTSDPINKERILIVGTVRNVEKKITRDLFTIVGCLEEFFEVDVHLIESDSSDGTPEVLLALSKESKSVSITFESLGVLQTEIPQRVERIRNCRNQYVRFIRSRYTEKNWKYIVVADLDGLNSSLDKRGIESSFQLMQDFDGVFANQSFGYYDLYALRAKNWMEHDILHELQEKLSRIRRENSRHLKIPFYRELVEFNLRTNVVYKEMRRIKRSSPPIHVDSAFGGLGIYNPLVFLKNDYSALTSSMIQSEHVDFHLKGKEHNFSFAINPNLVNNRLNTYNINRVKIIRMIRRFRFIQRLIQKFRIN